MKKRIFLALTIIALFLLIMLMLFCIINQIRKTRSLSGEVGSLSGSLKDLQVESLNMRTNIVVINNEISNLKAENINLHDKVASFKISPIFEEQAASLKTEIINLKTEISSLKAENLNLHADIAKIKDKIR